VIPIVVWCVSGPGIHGNLQCLVCRCTVGQTTNVAEDGVTTSDYGAEYAWQIRAVGYSPVGDEVIPSNAKNTKAFSFHNRSSPNFAHTYIGENIVHNRTVADFQVTF